MLVSGRSGPAFAGPRYQQIHPTGWPVSTYGGRLRGDAPPPGCWPVASPGPSAPRLAGPLWEGATSVQLPVATRDVALRVFRAPEAASDVLALFSPPLTSPMAPTSPILIAPPLLPHVGLHQTNGSGTVVSPEGVFITPFAWASEVGVPWLPYPVHADARAVAAIGLYPGAFVEVLVSGAVVGTGWTQEETALSLPLSGALTPGAQVRVRQTVAGTSFTSTARVVQAGTRPLRVPTVPWPVETGAFTVPVSGVTPGSLVRVTDSAGNILGAATFGEPYGHVPVCALPASYRVVVERGPAAGPTSAQTALLAARAAPPTGLPFSVDITTLSGVPAGPGSRWFKRYRPTSSPAAVLFVVHGDTDDRFDCEAQACGVPDYHFVEVGGVCYASSAVVDSNAFLGFDYLGEALANSGVYVVSVPAESEASAEDIAPPFELFIRDFLAEHPHVTDLPLFVSGLSNGGEAALSVMANLAVDFDLRGAFLMAPVSSAWGYDKSHLRPVFILSGDEDYLYKNAPNGDFERPPSHFENLHDNVATALIAGGSHAAFNTCWEGDGRGDDLRIPADRQRQLTVDLARRFIFDQLQAPDLDRVVGRLQAANLPPETWSLRPRVAWKSGERLIIENFGDPDPRFGIPGNNNSTLNTLGLVNDTLPASGASTGSMNELALNDTLHRPDNRTGRLDWHIDNFAWRTRTGNLDASTSTFLTIDTFHEASPLNRDHLPTDLLVVLRDTSGRTATVRLGIDHEVDAPWVKDAPAELTPPVLKPRRALETHALPLDAFLAENPALDLQHLERVLLRSWLPTTGSVHFDNLELRR